MYEKAGAQNLSMKLRPKSWRNLNLKSKMPPSGKLRGTMLKNLREWLSAGSAS